MSEASPASRLPHGHIGGIGAGLVCTCGSWLASDAGTRVCLKHRRQAGSHMGILVHWPMVCVHLWELVCQRCRRCGVSEAAPASRFPHGHIGGIGAGLVCSCGSWLASDAGTRVCLKQHRQAGSHMGILVHWPMACVHLWELACQRCSRPGMSEASPASRLPHGHIGGIGAGLVCTCGSWLASDAGARVCLKHRRQAGSHMGILVHWPRACVQLWELACQRCRHPGLSEAAPASRLPHGHIGGIGAALVCSCGSWLASDAVARVCLKQHRQAGCHRTGADLLCSRPRLQAPT